MDQKPLNAALSPRPSGAHVIIRVFNTGEPVYATTALTSNQPHSGPFSASGSAPHRSHKSVFLLERSGEQHRVDSVEIHHSALQLQAKNGPAMSSARVSQRISAIAESATLAVDAKAKALKAAGRPVIGFGAGEPDFPTPDYIVQAAIEAAGQPKYHRYSPAGGLPELKKAIAEKTLRDSGYKADPSQVLVTNGGKQAVYNTFATLVDPGDEVIVPTPFWTTYPEAIRLAGGVPVEVFAGPEQDYLVTVEQLEAAVTDRTKILLFVSPSNPTGSVYSPEQVAEIGK